MQEAKQVSLRISRGHKGDKVVNRGAELKELDAAAAAGGLLVFFGRRRVGKTRLLAHWLARHGGLYSQAMESSREIQLDKGDDSRLAAGPLKASNGAKSSVRM